MKNTRKNAGNAFVIILILIGLLAALTVTLTRMGSTTQDVSEEQARVIASQVLRQGRSMANAVDGLIAKGCSITQLSFENPVVTGYTNAQSPSDKSCWLFDGAGAGLAFPTAPANSDIDSIWHFSRSIFVLGVGKERESLDTSGTTTNCPSGSPDCQEIIAVLPFVSLNVCKAVNILTRVTSSFSTAPPQQVVLFPLTYKFSATNSSPQNSNFSISYNGGGVLATTVSGSAQTTNPFWDKKAGCFELSSDGYRDPAGTIQAGAGKYFFYQVLLER